MQQTVSISAACICLLSCGIHACVLHDLAGHMACSASRCRGHAQVSQMKQLIRKELIDRGDCLAYSEPESRVVSRSGDECVVALTDQWFLTYGEDVWRGRTQCASPWCQSALALHASHEHVPMGGLVMDK